LSTTNAGSLPDSGTWNVDGVHSTVSISVVHNTVAIFHASMLGISGTFEDGVLSGSIPADGLQIGLPIFKEHMMGEGFLDAANHPTLEFKSDEIHAHEDGTVHLSGELTIRGVTKPISAGGVVSGPTEVTRPDNSVVEVLGINLETGFDRRDFGLEVFAGAGWDVTLEVALELVKA
jgi:polyisoprenoid-binding protein YceI